ncbi:hypothetical protein T439DRAFT_376963 [Meredithblackwellia eburnea MCA 4105]
MSRRMSNPGRTGPIHLAPSPQMSSQSSFLTEKDDLSPITTPQMTPSPSFQTTNHSSVQMSPSIVPHPPPAKTKRLKTHVMFIVGAVGIGGIVAIVVLGVQGKF